MSAVPTGVTVKRAGARAAAVLGGAGVDTVHGPPAPGNGEADEEDHGNGLLFCTALAHIADEHFGAGDAPLQRHLEEQYLWGCC